MKTTKRDVLNSAKLQQQKNAARKRRAIMLSVTVVVFVVGLALLSRIPAFAITEVTVSGNKVLESAPLHNAVAAKLEGNYLHLFSRRNFLLYPKRSIEEVSLGASARIANVDVTRKDKHTLAVVITERDPAYVWCGEVYPVDTLAPKCYFLDLSGFAFADAPYFSGDAYFKFYGPLGGGIGTQFLDTSTVQSLSNAAEAFRGIGFSPVALAADARGEYLLYIKVPEADPQNYPVIKFRNTNDTTAILANLDAALLVEPLATKMKENISTLKYIDLRYDNKVYYKFDE